MIKIAHRGNIKGPNPDKENHPDYLLEAIAQGFDVEVDVWFIDGKYILGHDKPQYEVEYNFLLNSKFWHHAKNIPALGELNSINSYLINCFFHDTDDCVLTSGGWIWTYPGKELTHHSIAVMPERAPDWNLSLAVGICSDFPENY